ncbi:adenosylcobinamide-GDP ribazoletransferase [Desulfovibrio sp. OttesenSCG-928-G15]|nr:adenosylcobinamide-GDP ribazoletransferase [Desulfovibrio sp. OttesenSCG-928-G15]
MKRNTCLQPFLLALSFLTRLGPAVAADKEALSRSVIYYPLVGGLLGCLLTLPLAFCLTGLPALLQAWLYVGLSLWLTRALHLDGLADILDALGSGKHGREFRAVLKDSRTGVFGATGICMALCGQMLCVYLLLQQSLYAPLFAAPLLARCLPIFFTRLTHSSPEASLGAILATAPRQSALALALALVVLVGPLCMGWAAFWASLAGVCALLFFLYRISAREGGYNGDFFGFLISAGELVFLAACAAQGH